ncbi:argininosuccinate lyase [Candidatus Walczuchella monophlebidarum]|uniref:Argininosuccinate lyase n=1 Tax=Candidatus Walczuchella monophlebidarum TaxID=1415657 RepID=A0A068DQC4_9FLAO|nr:argininosuccinate lyase [Candidatus Walczuchella monophlebidarum]
MMVKLWKKKKNLSKEIEKFTFGKERKLDLLLAPYDIISTMAHSSMLSSIELLKGNEFKVLMQELKKIYLEIVEGNFYISDYVEDVHSQVEIILTHRLGEIGKKIHSGRSRNDQILLDLKLFIRQKIQSVVENVYSLFKTLLTLSDNYKEILMPGYTHDQIAMPSSFGLWFSSYAESLTDDFLLLQAAYRITNKNPLGSAAGFGSSLPLDREFTTHILGFENFNYNVIYAQMVRGKSERVVADALASISYTLAKLSQDICLSTSQNFGFITFPDHITTGSSIMPHKKNIDVLELIRSLCNKINSLPNEIAMIIANLPSGYHRDFQIIKEILLPIFDDLKSCLQIYKYLFEQMIINNNILNYSKYHYLFSVESVNKYVLEGMSFRDAYKKVGCEIQNGNFQTLTREVTTHVVNLCNENIHHFMKSVVNSFHFEKANEAVYRLLTVS